jgi:hypothetical protein
MIRKTSKGILMTIVLLALLALLIPAFAAENAKITKSGVDVYELPTFHSGVVYHMTYERRVEVVGEIDFAGTNPRFRGQWYRISTGLGEGFIYSTYVEVDAGVTVPMLDGTKFGIPPEPAPKPKPEKTDNTNATITGDGVRLRELPCITGSVWLTVDKGRRLEVTGVTPFSDTIDGYSAPWYLLVHGTFVFGRFIKLDAGVTVPELRDTDNVSLFIDTGLNLIGTTESDFISRLGQPLSRDHNKFSESQTFSTYNNKYYTGNDKLLFGNVEAEFYNTSVGTEVWKVTYKDGAYTIWGLKVGSTKSEVEELLGEPQRITDNLLAYYLGSLSEDEPPENASYGAIFTVRNGMVTEITFYSPLIIYLEDFVD